MGSGRKPVNRLECCCYDCYGAMRYAEVKQCGPAAPSRNMDLIYFSNDLHIERGADKIGFFKMKEGYPTTRLFAKCCWTVMLGHHPSYQEKIVVTYGTRGAGGSVADADLFPALARIFTKDMTPEELQALPPFHDPDA